MFVLSYCFFFFKQKPAYEMRISDCSSDVCSSDLTGRTVSISNGGTQRLSVVTGVVAGMLPNTAPVITSEPPASAAIGETYSYQLAAGDGEGQAIFFGLLAAPAGMTIDSETGLLTWTRSEEHTSELQ